MSATPLSRKEQVEGNLDLAEQLIQEHLANPATAADIPHGATVVLLPDDDPALVAANLTTGMAAVQRGENVILFGEPSTNEDFVEGRIGSSCLGLSDPRQVRFV